MCNGSLESIGLKEVEYNNILILDCVWNWTLTCYIIKTDKTSKWMTKIMAGVQCFCSLTHPSKHWLTHWNIAIRQSRPPSAECIFSYTSHVAQSDLVMWYFEARGTLWHIPAYWTFYSSHWVCRHHGGCAWSGRCMGRCVPWSRVSQQYVTL